MADNLLKCACRDYYNNLTGVSYSLNTLHIIPETSYNFKAVRPFVPLAIQKLLIDDTYEIDFNTSRLQRAIYPALFKDCLQASINLLNDSVADPKYTEGDFGLYLSQRIGVQNATERADRYQMASNLVFQFYENFDLTIGIAEVLVQFNDLVDALIKQTDKRYWIAPGSYHVSGTNPTNQEADAILAANPTWTEVRVLILEIDSIG